MTIAGEQVGGSAEPLAVLPHERIEPGVGRDACGSVDVLDIVSLDILDARDHHDMFTRQRGEKVAQASRVIIRQAPRSDHPTSQATMTQTATNVDSGNSSGSPPSLEVRPAAAEHVEPGRCEVGGREADDGSLHVREVGDVALARRSV